MAQTVNAVVTRLVAMCILAGLSTSCASDADQRDAATDNHGRPDRDAAPNNDPIGEKDAAPAKDDASTDIPEQIPTAPPVPTFDVRECENMGKVDYFRMIPSTPAPPIFSFADASCGTKPQSILIINTLSKPVRVNGIGVTTAVLDGDSAPDTSARFVARTLQQVLAPQEAVAMEVEFRAQMPYVSAAGDVVVATPEGCQTVGQLTGLRQPADVGVSFAPVVVDFGVLSPGEVGLTVQVEFTYRNSAAKPAAFFSTMGTMPSDVFQLIESVGRDIAADKCDRSTVPMQMTAPTKAGPVDGVMYIEIQTEKSSALGVIFLRGLVR